MFGEFEVLNAEGVLLSASELADELLIKGATEILCCE